MATPPDTLDDWLEEWHARDTTVSRFVPEAEVQRLVDHIGRLRTVVALQAVALADWERSYPNVSACVCAEQGTLMCPLHNVDAADA